jgi:hypothetical protein
MVLEIGKTGVGKSSSELEASIASLSELDETYFAIAIGGGFPGRI